MTQWHIFPSPTAVKRGPGELVRFNKALSNRRNKFPIPSDMQKHNSLVQKIKENGYVIIKDAYDTNVLKQLNKEVNSIFEKGEGVRYKNHPKHFQIVEHAFINCPSSLGPAFNDLLFEIVTQYFECIPLLSNANLRRSYVNSDPDRATQLFHCDPDSCNFLKCFFYLNDVDMSGGPFLFVEGSHFKKFDGFSKKHRWSDKEIESKYGKDSFKYLTANVGDMIIANTAGFHRGVKPTKQERTMLTVDFSVHGPKWRKNKVFQILESYVDQLPEYKKPMADFLVAV